MRASPALATLLLIGCTNPDLLELVELPTDKILEDLVAISAHPAEAHADDYPIHIHWITGEPEWEPLRLAVEAAARRWSHIIAPTPTAPYVFPATAECGHPDYGWLDFEAGDSLSAGLHLYVHTGPRRPLSVSRERYDRERVVDEYWGWAGECVPRSWKKTEHHMYRPVDSRYNPVSDATPAGVIGLPERRWGPVARDFHELTPRHAYVTALHLIGHVLGIGTGEKWWNNLEVMRGYGHLHSHKDSTWWVEDDSPAVFFTDSVAIGGLTQVLESQGRPHDGKMIPLEKEGMNVFSTATTSDTTFKAPAHWHWCLTRSHFSYDREAGGWIRATGELMEEEHASVIIDPRITAPSIAALQGFTSRPFSAEYMVYDAGIRDSCPTPNPDSLP